ncbi:MAG: hypothetical protein IK095_08305 [Oscillospiraceae bacterium]|nr:hypothetical protein [Oscillospiraceae bacterium]
MRRYYQDGPIDCDFLKPDEVYLEEGCFLTSACVEARGLADDCHELQVLRAYRDGYLRALPEGPAEIEEYYAIAPQIVEAIRQRSDAAQIFDGIYETLVRPCVELIERGEPGAAHALYRETALRLKEQYLG